MEGSMNDDTNTKGGFAHLSRNWLTVWQYLRDDERAVLPVLMSYLPNIWPSIETLAVRLGKGPRAVQITLTRMSRDGIISIESRSGGRGHTNQITLANVELHQVLADIVAKRKGAADDTLSEKGATDDTLSKGAANDALSDERAQSTARKGRSPLREKGAAGCARSNTSEEIQEKEDTGASPLPGAVAPVPPASPVSCEAGGTDTPSAPKVRKSRKSTRAPGELEAILRSDETRLAYITGGSMQWWPPGQSHLSPLPTKDLNAPRIAGAYWYFVASLRQANGTTPAVESLPGDRLFGQVASALKNTPVSTVWGWLTEACTAWPAARGRIQEITPENILQSWWREKLRQPVRAVATTNANASLCSVADPAAFGAELDSRIGKVRL
jgi:hypothetical protein